MAQSDNTIGDVVIEGEIAGAVVSINQGTINTTHQDSHATTNTATGNTVGRDLVQTNTTYYQDSHETTIIDTGWHIKNMAPTLQVALGGIISAIVIGTLGVFYRFSALVITQIVTGTIVGYVILTITLLKTNNDGSTILAHRRLNKVHSTVPLWLMPTSISISLAVLLLWLAMDWRTKKAQTLIQEAEIAIMNNRYSTREDLLEAEQKLRQALLILPTSAQAYTDLGTILKALGPRDEAEDAYKRAIELEPTVALYHYTLGLFYTDTPNTFKDAQAELRRAIDLDPRMMEAYSTLAYVDIKGQQCDEALTVLNTAHSINPNFGPLHKNYGDAYRCKKDYQKAIDHLQKSMEIEPRLIPEATYILSEVYIEQGDTQSACTALQLITTRYTSSLEYMPAKHDLKTLECP